MLHSLGLVIRKTYGDPVRHRAVQDGASERPCDSYLTQILSEFSRILGIRKKLEVGKSNCPSFVRIHQKLGKLKEFSTLSEKFGKALRKFYKNYIYINFTQN